MPAPFRADGRAARTVGRTSQMKLAVSSTSFADDFAGGALTQLEWLDLCAAELEADGVVFELRHFPRTDAEYVAQLKKMAVDLGLTVAALRTRSVEEAAGALE